MPNPATIRVQSADQGWQVLGVDRYRGVVPEGVKASANGWGPDLANFTLRRKPGAIFPDLATWTPCEIEKGGVVVWDGALKEAPESDGDDFQIGVVGAGWQYHLDDDTNERMWAHTRLPDWQDVRGFLSAPLGSFTAAWQVTANSAGITMALPAAATSAVSKACGVTLDTGDDVGAKRIVITYIGGGKAGLGLWVENGNVAHDGSEQNNLDPAPIATSSTTASFTFTTARRWVTIFLENDSGGAMTGDETSWVRLTSVQVFRSTAYESAGASILKTSDLVKDVLAWAPLLSQDTSLIQATTFNWPEFAPFDEKSAREIIEAANAAERMQARLRIGRQLEYRPYPTAPMFEIGEWSGAVLKDTSAGSGQEVYNKAKVKGSGPDGGKLTIVRTQTGTILDRVPGGARPRSKVLAVSIGLNTALGNKLGDAFLSVHRTTPLKGDVAVVGRGGVRRVEGGGVDPAHLLLNTGEMLRLSHRIDPDTGGWGRDGQIARVEADFDIESAVVTLDNERDNFEKLMRRMEAVVGSGS